MKNEYKLTFWKKLKYSIFNLENYQDLAAEKIWKTLVYIIVLMLIFSSVVSGIYVYKLVQITNNVKQYIGNNIDTITYEDNKLKITPKGENKELIIEQNETTPVKVLINTDILREEDITNKIEDMSLENNMIFIFGDRIFVKNELITTPISYKYSTIAEEYNINYLDKQEVINLLEIETINPLIVSFFIIIMIYMFFMYLSSVLVDIVIFSFMGYLVTLIAKIRIRYTAVYNIAVYATTLPILLNLAYIVINAFTGFTIKYFEIMYSAIVSIYIIAAILIIKTDVIKKQIELAKIIQEQDKVREELKRREKEEKEQAERERQKREDEEKSKKEENGEGKENEKKKTKDDSGIGIGKEPEGNNV